MHSLLFSSITSYKQSSEAASHIILQGRMTQTAAALFAAFRQLRADGHAFIAAITSASPNRSAVLSPFVRRGNTDKPSESLPCQIPLPGLHLAGTTAVCDSTPLQTPGIQHDLPAAITGAAPDGIPILSLLGLVRDHKFSYTKARFNSCFCGFFRLSHQVIPSLDVLSAFQVPASPPFPGSPRVFSSVRLFVPLTAFHILLSI